MSLRHPFPQALVAVLLLLAATLAAVTPVYQQNDDVVMTMMASGRGLALEPGAHLVYVNVLLGELLRRAYGWAPDRPWYGLLLVGGIAATLVALLRSRLASWRHSVPGAGTAERPWPAFLAYFAAVGIVFVARLQFTAVAGLAAGTGLALWLARLDRGREAPGLPADRLAAGALLLLGGLLRFQALLLALVVATPLLLNRLLARNCRRALRDAGGLVAVLALALALQLADRTAYQGDPGWREFLELNAWRARIVDYGAGGDGLEGRALEQRLGWSVNDGLVLRRWLYADREVFPSESMRALVAAAPVARPSAVEAWTRVREAFAPASFVPLALVLPLLALGLRRTERTRVLLLALAPAVIVVALLAILLRAPEHVALPALAFAPTALFALARGDGARRRSWWWAAVALAAAGAVLAGRQARVEGAAAAEENRDLRRSVAMLASAGNQLHVEWAGAFRYEAMLPLEDQSYLAGVRLYSLGWPQRSPVADGMLRRLGIGDVVRSLYERDDVGLLMNPAWQDSLAAYVREHYGAPVGFRATVRTPSFTVFRVERTDAAQPAPAAR